METVQKYHLKPVCVIAALCIRCILFAQPVANFSALPVSGCAPLVVQFTDNSTGNPTAWSWQFGNSATSSQKNPVTTYFTPGVYTVKLTASNTAGSNSITKTQYITVYDKPVVKFTVSDSSDCIPFTTTFTDVSTTLFGNITSWQWDFDDGTTSTLQNPQHLYNQAGNYNITLNVTNSGGCTSSLSKLAYIKAADSIRTQFTFTQPSKCKPPETIYFTNYTVGPGTMTYTWNFGDGITSSSVSPSHIFTTGGSYSITLITQNSLGCKDTLVLKDTITIKNVRSAINSDDTVCVNYRMPLNNATIPAPLSSKWIYSDGTSSFGASTAKMWTTAGNHTVKLISNFNACSDSVTKNIRVLPAPVINFSASDSASCKPPFIVNFTDLSNNATNWLWDFGDGFTSAVQNPSHTYTTEGEFTVKLTVNSATGCNSTLPQFRFIRILKPQVNIDTTENGGCIPYTFAPHAIVGSVDGISSYLWDFGNGNTSTNHFPVEVYNNTGSYNIKLTITTVDGCIDSVVRPAGVKTGTHPVIDFGLSPAVVCPGVPVQFTDLSTPADRWLWKFGNGNISELQNPTHKFSDSGKYSIKLIAWNNGCDDSLTKPRVLTVLPGLARFRPVYNCVNKKEVFFKDSSILPQTWLWDFGDGYTDNTQNPTHLFANYQTYNVSLTTTNGACTNTRIVAVKLLNEIPGFVATKNSLCKPDSVIFYMQNFNKDNIASYIWDFGDGTVDSLSRDSVRHTYNSSGFFTVSLTAVDSNGCSQTTSKANFIHSAAPKAGFAVSVTGGCRNKIVTFTDTSIAGIAKCFWDFGDGQTQNFTAPLSNTVAHVYTSAGYYYPSLKVIDSVGCADSISYSTPVRIYQPVANFFSPNYNTCINDTVIIRNPSSGNRLTYSWSFGDGSFSPDSLPIKKYSVNGDFTIKLVVTDATGCQDSMIKNNYIKVRDVIASFGVSDSVGICTPFKVSFTNTSTNALSQLWDFGDGGFSSTANPVYYYLTPGIYYTKLTARRTNHCANTDSVKIVIKGPTASLNYGPLNGCNPLNVNFNVITSDTLSFIWDFNDGTTYTTSDSSTNHSYLLPGSFIPSVVVKDSSGCIIPLVGTDTIKMYGSSVNFGAVDTSICFGDPVYFSDSSVAGSAVASYTWDFGDGNFSTAQNPSHYYNNPGTYTVKLFVSTVYGCTDSLVKTNYCRVFTTPQISITGNNPSYCGQTAITFSGNATTTDTSAATWHWNFANGQVSSLQNPLQQQYTDTGHYNIQLLMKYNSGCADTAVTSVRILPVPNTFAGNDTAVCDGTTALLHASGADNYTWQPANNLSCVNCSNTICNTSIERYYYVKGTNNVGCEKTDSIYVDVKKRFNITGLNNTAAICQGKNIQLAVSGAENYSWSPAAGLSNAAIPNPLASPSTNTTYKVVGYDSINCFKDSASILIEVYPAPRVNAGPDIILNAGKEVTLRPQYSNDVSNWLWQPSTGLHCTDCPNPVATPANGITYKITVANSNGCTATDEIFIQLKCDKSNIYMPTAFSPNGINKIFYPLTPAGTLTFTITAFKIYNRMGELVFYSGNFNTNDISKGWNGKYKGVDAPSGAYVYTIEFVCASKQVVSFSGNILLLR
ncbi:MAG: PKD domain-containing protein [Bacteroidota bacterium]